VTETEPLYSRPDALVAMSLAAKTRETVRARPALRAALAVGAVNYTAAARLVAADVGADPDDHGAVAAALRRYADDLDVECVSTDAIVRMVTDIDVAEETDAGDELLAVGSGVVDSAGSRTALVAESGDLDGRALGTVLARLDAEGIAVAAAGTAGSRAVVVVDRRDGADALRAVEDALDSVPVVGES